MQEDYKTQPIREVYPHFLSQDYEMLWGLICSGKEIIGVLDSKESYWKDEQKIFQRIVVIKRSSGGVLSISSPGVGYSMGDETKKDFLRLSKYYNLSFIDIGTKENEQIPKN